MSSFSRPSPRQRNRERRIEMEVVNRGDIKRPQKQIYDVVNNRRYGCVRDAERHAGHANSPILNASLTKPAFYSVGNRLIVLLTRFPSTKPGRRKKLLPPDRTLLFFNQRNRHSLLFSQFLFSLHSSSSSSSSSLLYRETKRPNAERRRYSPRVFPLVPDKFPAPLSRAALNKYST